MDTNEARLKVHDTVTDILTDFADGDEEDREALAIVVDSIFDALDIQIDGLTDTNGETRVQCSLKLQS